MIPRVPKLHSLWALHLAGTGLCKATNSTAKRRSLQPQKTRFPTKEDFLPLGNTHRSMSEWPSRAVIAGGMTSQNTELQALREEVKQLSAAFPTSTLTTPPISPPQSLPTPTDQPAHKKRRPQPNP
ncbi:hypothetical protein MRX96_050174 [Rhipicephalus microplus]